MERRSTAIKVTIIEPDKKKIRALATDAARGTAGVPKIIVLEEVSDEKKIEKMDLPATPAIVINGELKSSGKILNKEEFRKLFLDYLQAASQ
ncbi:MAG: thioredoxin family protein [Firmicutes bacterium]|nr:thioredoxin family protein [Bacillota bacterium]